jgi:hypothetical protein
MDGHAGADESKHYLFEYIEVFGNSAAPDLTRASNPVVHAAAIPS